MNENEINKRMNATVDILTWLDQRIAKQVEHQLAQRLALEREHWRRAVTDLIVEERERLVEALSQKLFDGEAIASITKIVKEGLDQAVNAKLAELDRRFAASTCRDDAPLSKH